MTTYTIGIVACEERAEMAHELFKDAKAKLSIVDDGTYGCLGNHHMVQRALVKEPGWSVVLEDDAIPLNDFHDDLNTVLSYSDSQIVSLYLGTGYPSNWQPRIERALLHDTSYIKCDRLLHAVGYAIAPEIKDALATWLGRCLRMAMSRAPEDAITTFARQHQIPVLYTNPSLVDHRDGPPAIGARDRGNFRGSSRPRHAWNTSQRLTWDDSSVTMTT